MGQGTLGVVRDGSLNPRGGPGRVVEPSRRFESGRGNHPAVCDVLVDL